MDSSDWTVLDPESFEIETYGSKVSAKADTAGPIWLRRNHDRWSILRLLRSRDSAKSVCRAH